MLAVLLPLSLFMVVSIANHSFTVQTPQQAFSDFQEQFHLPDEVEILTTKLYAGGDIMLSRGIGYYNKQNNWTRMFDADSYNPIREWCQNDCLLIFNLESLFSRHPNDRPESTFHFAANTKNIDILHRMRAGNPLYLSIANNHTRNVGKAGVLFTRAFLDQEQIWYGGAGEDLTTTGFNVSIIDRDGIRVCIASVTYDGGIF